MTTPHRDLAQLDHWQRSLERSLHRRAILPQIRRSVARRRRASVALSTLMVAGPTGSLLAAGGFGGRGVDVAQASPASRAIDTGATPAAMAFELGSRGDAVAEIQRQLGAAPDGVFGPLTHAAVTDFQARNGLEVDGIVGPATWTALFGLEQAAAAAGARDGSVAVILRERDAASGASGMSGSAPAGAGRSTGDAPAVGGRGPLPDPGSDTRTDGGRSPLPQPGSDAPAPRTIGDDPASDGAPESTAPRTKPVSTPAPANGACGPLRLASPVKGTVTSPYGPRWGRNHDGLDIAAPTGTPIRAAECGIVSFAGAQGGYGNMVCVKHSSRFETCYAHMTKAAVGQGQRVQQGQVIGYVGCTGNCTGPHLHFETRVDGAARDPRPYLGGGSIPGAPTVKAAVDSKSKAVASAAIAKGVERARFAKVAQPASTQATTAWSPQDQPVARTQATVTPTTTAPAPAPATPTYAAPDEPTYAAPEPSQTAPEAAYAAPEPSYTAAPEPAYAAPESTYTAPVPQAAPVAPAPEPAPLTATPEAAPVTPEAAPVTPAPEAAPVIPAPEAAPVTPVQDVAPVTPAPEAAPVTPTGSAPAVPTPPVTTTPAAPSSEVTATPAPSAAPAAETAPTTTEAPAAAAPVEQQPAPVPAP